MKLSTIKIADIIPEATKAINRYTKRSDVHTTLFRYDTHLTTDDLVMDTVEKVVKANPQYLTKTYVWLAAKSVCINRCNRKKLATVPCLPMFSNEDSCPTPIEEELPGNTHDILTDLLEFLVVDLDKNEKKLTPTVQPEVKQSKYKFDSYQMEFAQWMHSELLILNPNIDPLVF